MLPAVVSTHVTKSATAVDLLCFLFFFTDVGSVYGLPFH